MSTFINQMEPSFDGRETQALVDYMNTGGWLTEFKRTQEFESLIAQYTGAKHCIVVNNGTVTLTMALVACGVGPGDEVIVPNFTMIATPNSAKLIGATPVFVDVEPETLCMDLDKLRAAFTPRTKAVFLVAANGRYPKRGYAPYLELCAEKGVPLLEDSAQALGSRAPDGRHLGTFGLIGSFSFSVPKIITTGQGGALVTNDDAVYLRLKKMKDFGRTSGGNDVHDSIGWNFKFTELQAVIGVEQMKKLPARVERKKDILRRYRAGLAAVRQVRFFEQDLSCTTPWFIDTLCENRDALAAHLKAAGIGSRVMYPPINKQQAYQVPGEHPVSNLVGRDGLWLPSASQLTDEQIDRICASIAAFYR